jgi:hypothetical protein
VVESQPSKLLVAGSIPSPAPRDFDGVLAQRVLEGFAESGLDARKLYESLPVSDQAQMREFYLSKLETVDIALRHKFKKLYQYY